MKCNNCQREIVSTVCQDIDDQPICFDCWFSSFDSTDGTIYCPKCLGLGRITQYFKAEVKFCEVCKYAGRIKAANVERVGLPIASTTFSIVDLENCPF